MLSLKEIADELTLVEYKKGWTFEVYEDVYEGHKMLIKIEVPNGYNPDEIITLGVHTFMPPLPDFKTFHEWMLWRIGRIELHEMREFYRINGVLFDDPHKEKES